MYLQHLTEPASHLSVCNETPWHGTGAYKHLRIFSYLNEWLLISNNVHSNMKGSVQRQQLSAYFALRDRHKLLHYWEVGVSLPAF